MLKNDFMNTQVCFYEDWYQEDNGTILTSSVRHESRGFAFDKLLAFSVILVIVTVKLQRPIHRIQGILQRLSLILVDTDSARRSRRRGHGTVILVVIAIVFSGPSDVLAVGGRQRGWTGDEVLSAFVRIRRRVVQTCLTTRLAQSQNHLVCSVKALDELLREENIKRLVSFLRGWVFDESPRT